MQKRRVYHRTAASGYMDFPGCKGGGAARNINKKSWVFAIYL